MSNNNQNTIYPLIDSPAYVLEENRLIANLEKLSRVRDEAGIEIILALKAFAMWSEFPLIGRYLNGATASSLYEAKLIAEEMKTLAHVYAPVFHSDEIEELAKVSQTIVFNSVQEYHSHGPEFLRYRSDMEFGLRVNPGYSEIETDLYNPAAIGSRLGIPSLTELPQGVTGLHMHALCENNSFTFERVLQSFEHRFAHLLPHIHWVNFGGGHLITQADYDIPHLINVLKSFKQRYPHLKVILEPGSAIAWQTGFLKASVLDIVETPVQKILILDVSFTAHMPDCLEMPYNPAIRKANYGSEGKFVYQLGGMSCLAGDQLGPYSFERAMDIGDEIIFEDMIHYTMVKTTMFNGVRHPDIGKIDVDGNYHLIRRFNYSDFKQRLS
ncbi:carboxynorspermidine decarboxylase [Membranihabitans marinus]|uniref:carboxynorspermidine decarboxylase n=1 Tax=Membranihabitans marinus TaxID=1227546 RepID=UPI001F017261|nr:carboxynorspermidine decarboxylase [Membranihabitans marinus]